MKALLGFACLLLAASVHADDSWQWIKTVNKAPAQWQSLKGVAQVTIAGEAFEAKLYMPKDSTTPVATLKGTISRGIVSATETLPSGELEEAQYKGTYKTSVGMESITLSDGWDMIGLTRKAPK